MTNKRFTDVRQMVREMSEDQGFADDFSKRLAQRQIVKQMQALRAAAGMSQQDIAEKLQCTQGRVSKLERGTDADLRFSDFFAYADALGLDARLVISKKGRTAVDGVKYHAFAIKRLLDELAHLAMRDEVIANGVSRFYEEAAINLINMLNDSAEKLPQRSGGCRPLIEIEEIVEAETKEPCDGSSEKSPPPPDPAPQRPKPTVRRVEERAPPRR
jgi:transcriptional regulator with XRE-family HTH domain